MIQEIKLIIENYLSNAKLCNIILGTVVNGGVRINDKIVIPNELIVGNLKQNLELGNKVRILRNHGGRQFFILEVVK